MVRDRQLTDWRLRLEDLVSEIEAEAESLEELDAQSELEAVVERLRSAECELEQFQEDRLG